MYIILNKKTKNPLRLTYSNDTHGSCYMTYERPTFSLEESDNYNKDCPIFTTASLEQAESIINGKHSGEDNITLPSIEIHYDDGERSEYEVKEITVK